MLIMAPVGRRSSQCWPAVKKGLRRAAAALRIAGRHNAVAGALSRFTAWAKGGGQYPNRELRSKFRGDVEVQCGRKEVDMMASGGGSNAWRARFLPPSNSAFGGPLPLGRLWRFPRAGLIQLVLPRIGESFKGDWYGANVCLLPV